MNKSSSLITRLICPDPVLFWAYALPIIYWIYLTLTANLVLVFDAERYYDIANLFYTGHWTEYFRTGPNREPGYSLVIAASMVVGKCLSVSYTYPLKVFCFGILAATMAIIQQCLKIINANRWIIATAILYTGFSPILVNSALCLYSEIATFPWLVAAVFISIHYLRSLRELQTNNFAPAIGLGLCFLGFTLVKGLGEGLCPLFLSWLLWYAWRCSGLRILSFLRQSTLKILFVLFAFYIPLFGFKSLNLAFNGHFSVTDRAELALYGPVVQRAENPLTLKNLLIHLSTVPISYPSSLCSHFFSDEQCTYWYRAPDDIFQAHLDQLNKKNFSPAENEKIVHQAIIKAFFSHPVRQFVYMLQEGLKMFFWETSQGPFVAYPTWLVNIFNNDSVVAVTSLVAGAFCLVGFLIACFFLENELILVTVVLTGLLIFIFSFFTIISRYAIIIAPLMILINASCLSVVTKRVSQSSGNSKRI